VEKSKVQSDVSLEQYFWGVDYPDFIVKWDVVLPLKRNAPSFCGKLALDELCFLKVGSFMGDLELSKKKECIL